MYGKLVQANVWRKFSRSRLEALNRLNVWTQAGAVTSRTSGTSGYYPRSNSHTGTGARERLTTWTGRRAFVAGEEKGSDRVPETHRSAAPRNPRAMSRKAKLLSDHQGWLTFNVLQHSAVCDTR